MFTERIKNWKQITAGFVIFGFILSFITGLIGAVGFGVVILRAFIFAVLFGGISMLVMYVIDTFIPELINQDIGEDTDIPDSAEIIEDNETASAAGAGLNGVNLDITVEDDASDDAAPVQELEEMEAVTAADEVEELEEVESAESAESVNSFKPAEAVTAGKAASGEEIPDIEEFSDSFTPAAIAGDIDGLSSIDGMGSSSGAEIMGDMHDTQDIVKAVKTVLKKDQEG